MAVIAQRTGSNYTVGNYTRLLKAEFHCQPDDTLPPRWVFIVGFYASEEARVKNPRNPMNQEMVVVTLDQLAEDPRPGFYEWISKSHLFEGLVPEADTNTPPKTVEPPVLQSVTVDDTVHPEPPQATTAEVTYDPPAPLAVNAAPDTKDQA